MACCLLWLSYKGHCERSIFVTHKYSQDTCKSWHGSSSPNQFHQWIHIGYLRLQGKFCSSGSRGGGGGARPPPNGTTVVLLWWFESVSRAGFRQGWALGPCTIWARRGTMRPISDPRANAQCLLLFWPCLIWHKEWAPEVVGLLTW